MGPAALNFFLFIIIIYTFKDNEKQIYKKYYNFIRGPDAIRKSQACSKFSKKAIDAEMFIKILYNYQPS